MTNFNYFKLNDTKKIRYLKHVRKDSDYIVFLHGFMSDLEGKKPKTFLKFAKENKLGFLALELLFWFCWLTFSFFECFGEFPWLIFNIITPNLLSFYKINKFNIPCF